MEAELFEGWPDSTDPDTNLTLILTYSSRTTAPTAQPTLELEFARNAQKREGGAASDMRVRYLYRQRPLFCESAFLSQLGGRLGGAGCAKPGEPGCLTVVISHAIDRGGGGARQGLAWAGRRRGRRPAAALGSPP